MTRSDVQRVVQKETAESSSECTMEYKKCVFLLLKRYRTAADRKRVKCSNQKA